MTVLACLPYGGNYAYEQWQARQDEVAAQRSDSTQDELTKSLSAPANLKQLGVAVPERTTPTIKGEVAVGDTLVFQKLGDRWYGKPFNPRNPDDF